MSKSDSVNRDIDVTARLEQLYENAVRLFGTEEYSILANQQKSISKLEIWNPIPVEIRNSLLDIAKEGEDAKGVLAVLLTSMSYKYLHPAQDIRYHQAGMENGYSGRVFDKNYITPFIRSKGFPAMAECGWMTRSLEQKHPYDMNYPGAIQKIKKQFLDVMNHIATQNADLGLIITFFLSILIEIRDSKIFELAKPQNLSISTITEVLIAHFNHKYNVRGASRLPVLAFYAIYQVLLNEIKRYNNKTLLPLENHNSADSQSGRLGDIDIVDENGNPFEAVEIKHGVVIDKSIVERAKEKILPSSASRYYILSTSEIKKSEQAEIETIIAQIKNTHGCQIVINGIIPSLKYYLRLIENPSKFIGNYVELLKTDETVKYEHRKVWNDLIGNL